MISCIQLDIRYVHTLINTAENMHGKNAARERVIAYWFPDVYGFHGTTGIQQHEGWNQ